MTDRTLLRREELVLDPDRLADDGAELRLGRNVDPERADLAVPLTTAAGSAHPDRSRT
jgi:hypothetical protein